MMLTFYSTTLSEMYIWTTLCQLSLYAGLLILDLLKLWYSRLKSLSGMFRVVSNFYQTTIL